MKCHSCKVDRFAARCEYYGTPSRGHSSLYNCYLEFRDSRVSSENSVASRRPLEITRRTTIINPSTARIHSRLFYLRHCTRDRAYPARVYVKSNRARLAESASRRDRRLEGVTRNAVSCTYTHARSYNATVGGRGRAVAVCIEKESAYIYRRVNRARYGR